MIEFRYTGDELYARMNRAVEKVNQRLRKTVETLEASGIPYAIVGGYAVRAWVAQGGRGRRTNSPRYACLDPSR